MTDSGYFTLLAVGWTVVAVAVWQFWKHWYKGQISTEQSRATYWKERAEEAEKQYGKLKGKTDEKQATAAR